MRVACTLSLGLHSLQSKNYYFSILQMLKLRHREMQCLIQIHTGDGGAEVYSQVCPSLEFKLFSVFFLCL